MVTSPAYSLYDLYLDINNGKKTQFKYNDKDYVAKRNGVNWIVTSIETGFSATCPFYIGSMTDFHGVAACLDAEKRTINFNGKGMII